MKETFGTIPQTRKGNPPAAYRRAPKAKGWKR